jgi:3-oxoacyl-[acyl-carrier protein] reductase
MQQTALVTGASRGIGQATALMLAQNGIKVIGTATSAVAVEQINNNLSPYQGCGVLLSFPDTDIAKFVAEIIHHHGMINVLVNNAAITRDKLLLRMHEADWDEVLDTNLKAVFLLTKAIIKGMLTLKSGKIINMTSVVGFMGNAGQANYAAAKGGIVAFTKSIAKELGSRGITANCVAPGFVDTAMTQNLSPDIKAKYIASIPLARFGTTLDIAHAVNFLASSAANYITGTTIHVNGGMYL